MCKWHQPQFPRRKGLLHHSINQSINPYTFTLDFNLKLHMPSIPSNSSKKLLQSKRSSQFQHSLTPSLPHSPATCSLSLSLSLPHITHEFHPQRRIVHGHSHFTSLTHSHTHASSLIIFQILQPTPNPGVQNSKKHTTNPGQAQPERMGRRMRRLKEQELEQEANHGGQPRQVCPGGDERKRKVWGRSGDGGTLRLRLLAS